MKSVLRSSRSLLFLTGLLVPAAFFVLVFRFVPFREVFLYNWDEGLCLMRGLLHAQGHSLYKEIWMDQPPFLTLLLSGLFRVFGPSAFHARVLVLVLVLSTLLLWGLFQIIRKSQNFLSAVLTVGLLVFSSHYLQLSVSVMIGLPAVALAVLSCYGLFLYQTQRRNGYLWLSGCLMALALQTKLFVVAFVPALIYELVAIEGMRQDKERPAARPLSAVLSWSIALSAVYLLLTFVVTSIDFTQIVQSHVISRERSFAGFFQEYAIVQKWISEEYDIALLALGGAAFFEKKQEELFPRSSHDVPPGGRYLQYPCPRQVPSSVHGPVAPVLAGFFRSLCAFH